MYGVEVEYWAEDRHGEVKKRRQTMVLAVQPGERIVTDPKVTVVVPQTRVVAPAVDQPVLQEVAAQ